MHVEVDGLRLFVDVLSPEYVADGPRMRRRPVAVVLHGGLTGDSSTARPLGDLITDAAGVVIPDRRGNGRSDGGGDPAAWTFDRFGDDVYDLCRALGIVRPVVIGSSYGGLVALAYATRHPGHPGGLAVLSAGAALDRDAIVRARRRADAVADPAVREQAAEQSARVVQRRGLADYPEHLHPWNVDFHTAVAAIACPTLVAVGDADPAVPVPVAAALAAGIDPALVRFEVIEGAGHELEHDAPERLGPLLRDFVTAVGAPPDPWAGGRTPYDTTHPAPDPATTESSG